MPIGRETAGFLLKKLKPLYPEVVISWLIGSGVLIAATRQPLLSGLKMLLNYIWEPFLAIMSGLYTGSLSGIAINSINPVLWYLSSMFICMAILYPLIRKYPDPMIHVVLPVASLLILGYLCRQYKGLTSPFTKIGWTYKGNLRAFAIISLGVLCRCFSKWLASVQLNLFGKIILTVLEPLLYTIYIMYMYYNHSGAADYVYIMLLFLAVGITLSDQALFQTVFNKPIFYFMGRFSMPLFLSHHYYARLLNNFLPDGLSNFRKTVIYFAVSGVTALFVYLSSMAIRKGKLASRTIQLFLKK